MISQYIFILAHISIVYLMDSEHRDFSILPGRSWVWDKSHSVLGLQNQRQMAKPEASSMCQHDAQKTPWGQLLLLMHQLRACPKQTTNNRDHQGCREKKCIIKNWVTWWWKLTSSKIYSLQGGDTKEVMGRFQSKSQQARDPGRVDVSVWFWRYEKCNIPAQRQSQRRNSLLLQESWPFCSC